MSPEDLDFKIDIPQKPILKTGATKNTNYFINT